MYEPAALEVRTPERIARWRPLVQWFLAIPHLIIAGALGYVAGALAIVSWFIILFTGKLPNGLAELQVMIVRYKMRANVYAGFLHDEYPPFEFATSAAEPGGTPVDVNTRPALTDRNRLTVGLRFLWVIPAALFAWVILFAASIVWFIGFFAVLFTGRWPDGLRDFVVKGLRVSVRLEVYALLLTDEYPPFSLDDGAADTPAASAAPPPPPPSTPGGETPPPPPPPSSPGGVTPPAPPPPTTPGA